MKVEIWSDVICPWCGIGQHRLDAALKEFAHRDDVEVVHKSFQLDPSFPVGTTKPVREMLRQKYGMSESQLRANMERIEGLAKLDGLQPYKVGSNDVGNTGYAHALLAWAAEQGMEDAAWKRLYHAYFGEGGSIFDVDALVALAVELGLDGEGAREAITSGRYARKVTEDHEEARSLGATGVPFVVIDRKYGIAGAQPVATFRAALEQAWKERPLQTIGEGEVCGPDGCEVPGSDAVN